MFYLVKDSKTKKKIYGDKVPAVVPASTVWKLKACTKDYRKAIFSYKGQPKAKGICIQTHSKNSLIRHAR